MEQKKFVITVTNQFCSMGRVIARRMSELLGVRCYNDYIVKEAARRLSLPADVVDQAEERSRKIQRDTIFPTLVRRLGDQTNETQNRIFRTQVDIIKALAEEENCVIVGRCSDFILNELDYAVHIYIYAPFKDRVGHCMKELEIGEEAALRQVTEMEESRIAYHLNYTGFRPDDKNHKDILINSSLLGVEATAQLLANIVKQRFQLSEP